MSRKVTMLLRIILALILIIFGINKFAGFLPEPELVGDSKAFIDALINAGYWPVLGVLETFAGVLLISNKWVGFALVLIAAIVTNILIFHFKYDLAGIFGPAGLITVLTVALIYGNWGRFRSLL